MSLEKRIQTEKTKQEQFISEMKKSSPNYKPMSIHNLHNFLTVPKINEKIWPKYVGTFFSSANIKKSNEFYKHSNSDW